MWALRIGDAATTGALTDLLPAGERRRADGFAFDEPRARFVAGRTALRTLLADRLGADPARLPLVFGPHGKPSLAGPDPIPFNISHSGELVLIAIGGETSLGIDVEVVEAPRFSMRLAARVLAASELRAVRRIKPSGRAGAFFDRWVAKEACAKALGVGLGLPFSAFSIAGGRPRAEGRGVPSWIELELERLTVVSVPVGEGCAAAICSASLASLVPEVRWFDPRDRLELVL